MYAVEEAIAIYHNGQKENVKNVEKSSMVTNECDNYNKTCLVFGFSTKLCG